MKKCITFYKNGFFWRFIFKFKPSLQKGLNIPLPYSIMVIILLEPATAFILMLPVDDDGLLFFGEVHCPEFSGRFYETNFWQEQRQEIEEGFDLPGGEALWNFNGVALFCSVSLLGLIDAEIV